jgi:LysM repeat protein/ABC-type branched-subunit amino acid transport system substrate-binding protein
MKKIKLLILFLFLSTAISIAQQKKYVSYTVEKGETIKSIARNYNMSTRDLLRLNPDVRRKPKPNTVIIVPNMNFGKEAVTIIKEGTSLYNVKPKETLFGISKKFGITIEELKAVNPQLSDGVKIGMKLVIPEPSKTQLKDSINYVLHSVVLDDTLYNLTKKYEVSKDDLLNLNPILKEGLRLGMLLKIMPVEIVEEEVGVFHENINVDKELNVVFMLPYQLKSLNDSITKADFNRGNSLLNYATDFHLGASMAIDSLRQKGLSINVKYFDTENSNIKLQRIVSQNDFSRTDVVIGPLFFDKAYLVSKKLNAPVIAPVFSKKQSQHSTGNLIKSAPNLELYEDKLMAYMEKNYKGENIIVVNDENPANQSKLWRIVNKIKSFDSITNNVVKVVKPANGYIDSDGFIKKMDTLAKNWVVLISDEIITTSSTINNLKSFVEDVDIRLFALNKGKNFDNINNSFLGKMKFVFPSSEFMIIGDKKNERFFEKYKNKNYALPSNNAIRGFDVTYDALIRLASGEDLEEGLNAGKSFRISSVFNYNKKLFGSYENKGVFLIQYTKDLETIILE